METYDELRRYQRNRHGPECDRYLWCMHSCFVFRITKTQESLSIRVNFYEKSHVVNKVIDPRYMILASELNDEDAGPLLLGFNTRNNCTEDVVIVGFSERARFNHTFKALFKRLSRMRHKKPPP